MPVYYTGQARRDQKLGDVTCRMKDCQGTTKLIAASTTTMCYDALVPMKIVAGAGAVFAPAWNGVAVALGSDRSTTRTGRWSRRISVKNLA